MQGAVRTLDPDALRRRLERTAEGRPLGVLDEFLVKQQPIHFGGMADPFSPLERQRKVTKLALEALSDFAYPTVISTKSDMPAQDAYLRVLRRGRYVVQVSLSSTDARLISNVDRGTAGPARLMKMLEILRDEGIPTTCRIQPLLPTREADADDLIDACAEAGVKHVAVEHLKVPIERQWKGTAALSTVLGFDVVQWYLDRGARRVGREWVLPVQERLANIVRLRDRTRKRGMTFGSADTDLLPLSDGECCCSGVGNMPGFRKFNRATYTHAVRQGLTTDNQVSIDGLSGDALPGGSVARYVNSSSRIMIHPRGASLLDYLRRNWNGSANGCSPKNFWGVTWDGAVDSSGHNVYKLSREFVELNGNARPSSPHKPYPKRLRKALGE